MANVLAIAGAVILLSVGLSGAAMIQSLLYPKTTSEAAQNLKESLPMQLLHGLLTVLFGAFCFAIFLYFRYSVSSQLGSWLDPLRETLSINRTWATDPRMIVHVLGYCLMVPWFVAFLIGLAGWSQILSEACAKRYGNCQLKHSLAIVSLVIVAAFVPFLGWFLIAPMLVLSSLGVGVKKLQRTLRFGQELSQSVSHG